MMQAPRVRRRWRMRSRRLVEGAGAVAFEGEQLFAGPEARFDSLPDPGEVWALPGLVFATGTYDRGVLVFETAAFDRSSTTPE
jgi:hypothetical protein